MTQNDSSTEEQKPPVEHEHGEYDPIDEENDVPDFDAEHAEEAPE